MNELFSVKDQVVVITGGTGVLGACIGKYLATQGAKVVLMGRRKDEGDHIVNEITEAGGEAMFLVTDVMDEKVVKANCDEILARYGRVDALLNAPAAIWPEPPSHPQATSSTCRWRHSARCSISTSPAR